MALCELWYAKNLVWHVSLEELVLLLHPALSTHGGGVHMVVPKPGQDGKALLQMT